MGAKEPKSKGNGELTTSRNPWVQSSFLEEMRPALTVTPELLAAIDIVVRKGCAIIIGGTRDGGAYSFTILDGDERHRTFAHSEEELKAAAQNIMQFYS